MLVTVNRPKLFDHLRDGVTQSLLLEFAACRRRAQLSYIKGYSSEYSSDALAFGSLFHGALEHLYNNQHLLSQLPKAWLKETWRHIYHDYRQETERVRHWSEEDETKCNLHKAYLYLLLPVYFKKYWPQDRTKEWVKNEVVFKNVWKFNGLPFTGKFDRVARNQHGEIWVYETKTKSRIDPTLQDRLSFDFQSNFYMFNYWLETRVYPKGFVYDVIQRPQHRMGMKEDLPGFIKRVGEAIDDTFFQRITVTRTQQELIDWVNNDLTPLTQEFLDWRAGKLATYRNAASCETRYGACKFLKVCGLKDYRGLVRRTVLFPELAGE